MDIKETNKNIDYIVLKNGDKVYLDRIAHVLITEEGINNIDEIFFNTSYLINPQYYKQLADQCFSMAMIIRYMCDGNLTYVEALHKYTNEIGKQREAIYKNFGCKK